MFPHPLLETFVILSPIDDFDTELLQQRRIDGIVVQVIRPEFHGEATVHEHAYELPHRTRTRVAVGLGNVMVDDE